MLDFIKKLFNNNKTNTQIIITDLNKEYKSLEKLEIGLYTINSEPLKDKNLIININGVNYIRKTDEVGVARLNINLPKGDYKATVRFDGDNEYNQSTGYCKVTIKESQQHNFGYWVFGKNMKDVNLEELKNKKVNHIFLNYYAFELYNENEIKEWIFNANKNNINIHIWMQCFYNGEWINPATNDMSYKIEEAKKYASIEGVYGIHLDYLRYPGNAYKTEGSSKAIINFVKEIKNNIPDKVLSCAVMPENSAEYYYGQNFNELGKYLNFLIPMQYKGNYNAGNSWLANTTNTFSKQANIWSGLQSYKSDDDNSLLSEDELKQDIKTCIENGAKGVVIFRYGLSKNIDFNGV